MVFNVKHYTETPQMYEEEILLYQKTTLTPFKYYYYSTRKHIFGGGFLFLGHS